MDMKKYAGAGAQFIKVDDLRNGPRKERIIDIRVGRYDRPDASFDSGSKLGLNATNTKILIRAYGSDSREWIGQTVELYLGTTRYEGQDHESVLVRPISAAPPKGQEPPPASAGDFNDDPPF
jgi:hypothetical protein